MVAELPAEWILGWSDSGEGSYDAPTTKAPAAYGTLCGDSVATRALFRAMAALEGSDVPVLLHGESGTGREAAARAIHEHSTRRARRFVVLDARLFAMTRDREASLRRARALFAAAHGGTLFLYEIGELPVPIQLELLCTISNDTLREGRERFDVRLIAASRCDLRARVSKGRFSEALYECLAVVDLALPPLRDRPEDVPVLIEYFAEHYGAESLPETVVNRLCLRSFPGNISELRREVCRALRRGLLSNETSDDG